VLNAANEIAVEAFCNRQIKFTDISAAVARAMETHRVVEHPTLEQILAADAWARANTLNAPRG
jgi:1-deoxy-D-xylulose-5-phosphate reductoisomerase